MPQRVEQAQVYCHRCQRPTLHQRNVTETNHVLHLLLTLLCCLLWFPIWILIAIVNSMDASQYLCTACGQPAGVLTHEQHAQLAHQQAMERKAQAASVASQRQEAKAQRDEMVSSLWTKLSAFANASCVEIKALPARVDAFLVKSMGDEFLIMLWFLRIVIVSVTLGFVVGIMWILVALARTFVSS